MIGTFRIAAIDGIAALGRFLITLKMLMPHRLIAQPYIRIARDFGVGFIQDQRPVTFVDKDAVSLDDGLYGEAIILSLAGAAGVKQ